MEPHPDRLVVSVREAAAMLGISPRSIQKYIAANFLPCRKIGRRTLITIAALRTFIDQNQPSVLAKK